MLGIPTRVPWSEVDRYLAQALTIRDASLCPGGCGHYLDETSEMDSWHEERRIRCDACAAKAEAEKQEPTQPGELSYAVRVD